MHGVKADGHDPVRSERAPAALESVAVPALLGLAALVFWRSLSGAHELFQRDIHTLWRGQVGSFVSVVNSGSLPLWNPYVAFGRPMLADPGYQALYPWTWVYLFVPLSYGFALYTWLHVALCGLGVRRLALLAGLSPLGAFGAGCAALLSGPLLSYVNLTFQLAGAAWLPWTLVAALHAWREANRASILKLALTLALQVLAGSGEMLLAAGTVIAAGAGASCMRWGWSRRRLAALGLAGLLGGTLSAVQWAPTLALLRNSDRQMLDDHARGAWSLHPARLVEFVIPALLSDAPLRPAAREAFFNGREPLLNSVHLGAAVMALGTLAAIRSGGLVLAAAGAAVFFTLAALGPSTPLWPVVSAGPFGLFRFPEKWMLPAGLAMALLCGAGLDALSAAWTNTERRRARAVCGMLAAAAVGLGLAAVTGASWWPLIAESGLDAARFRFLSPLAVVAMVAAIVGRRIVQAHPGPRWSAIALGLLVASLLPVARDVNPTTPAAILSFVPKAAHLIGPTGVSRLQSRPPSDAQTRARLAREGMDIEPVAALARMEALSSPVSASWGIDGAFDADVTGLGLPEHSLLTSAAVQYAGSPLAERLLRLGAVTHVLAAAKEPFPGFTTLSAVPWIGGEPLVLLAVPEPRPRVSVVHRSRAVANARDAITLLGDPTFDLARETLLVGGPAMSGPAADSGCTVTHRAADSLDLKCSLAEDGVVVVADAWDPGWRASVDGTDAPVLRADVLFRGVWMAKGTHDVRLRYRPTPVILGALLTLAGALTWVALSLTTRRRA